MSPETKIAVANVPGNERCQSEVDRYLQVRIIHYGGFGKREEKQVGCTK